MADLRFIMACGVWAVPFLTITKDTVYVHTDIETGFRG